jgi:hypothetical protein
MKKVLLVGLLLLPALCLAWKWTVIPAQVALHFSQGGADLLGPKWMLSILAIVPLLLYTTLPLLRPANPREPFYRQLGVSLPLLFSLALSAWFVAMPTAG